MIVVLGVYEIPQGNSHYILYVESLIVLKSTLKKHLFFHLQNQSCIAQTALYSNIVALASLKIPPTIIAHFQQVMSPALRK